MEDSLLGLRLDPVVNPAEEATRQDTGNATILHQKMEGRTAKAHLVKSGHATMSCAQVILSNIS